MMKTKILFLVLVVLLVMDSATAGTYRIVCNCTGTCHGRQINATGARGCSSLLMPALPNPPYSMAALIARHDDVAEGAAYAGKYCLEAWAGTCGGMADFHSDDCPTDCVTWCQGLNNNVEIATIGLLDVVEIKANMLSPCKAACESKCEVNKIIRDVTDMVNYLAIIIAAVMFVIFGYKLMTSTDMEGRNDARKGIMFVILVLIMLLIAESLMNLLIGSSGISLPGASNSPPDVASIRCYMK